MSVQLTDSTGDMIQAVLDDIAAGKLPRPKHAGSGWLTTDEERCLAAKLYSARCQALAAECTMAGELDALAVACEFDQHDKLFPNYQDMSRMVQGFYELVDAR